MNESFPYSTRYYVEIFYRQIETLRRRQGHRWAGLEAWVEEQIVTYKLRERVPVRDLDETTELTTEEQNLLHIARAMMHAIDDFGRNYACISLFVPLFPRVVMQKIMFGRNHYRTFRMLVPLLSLLFDHGQKYLFYSSEDTVTCFEYAAGYYNNSELCHLLLDKGERTPNSEMLEGACDGGCVEIIKKIIHFYTPEVIMQRFHRAPFSWMCLEVLQTLLPYVRDVNSPQRGATLLNYVSINSNVGGAKGPNDPVIRFLLENGADPRIVQEGREPDLENYCSYIDRSTDIIELYVEKGADPRRTEKLISRIKQAYERDNKPYPYA